ncbi:MAG: hypothetical protein KDA91_14915 [Planctomycetaceae bacterium]|nr:hypothetical protein [Planctomycetaceae bacterium]
MSQHRVAIILLGYLLLTLSNRVYGQDSTNYQVRIPGQIVIRALDPAIVEAHPGTNDDVVMADQRWFALSTSRSGATVRFSTDHAFHNLSNAAYKRDARIQITRIQGTRSARWGFDAPIDQTNYAAGDEVATVQVSSRGPGLVYCWLDVTFLTDDFSTMAGGDYQLTVIGTIAEN